MVAALRKKNIQKKPLVSAYVVTYQSEKTLAACLGSLRDQVQEIIVVDNGSTDHTIVLAKKFGVKLLRNTVNNIALARNIVLSRCKYELVLAVDADIVLEKHWVQRALYHLKGNVAGVGGQVIEKDKRLYGRWVARHLPQQGRTYLSSSAFLSRKKMLLSLGGYREAYARNYEDVNLCKRLKQKGYTLYLAQECIAHHYKEYSFRSIMHQHWRYSFFDWPMPTSLLQLFLKVGSNFYTCLKYLFQDGFLFLHINLCLPVVQSWYDLLYFFTREA